MCLFEVVLCFVQVYGRNYFRPDQYVSKSVMEKRALPYVQAELLRHHANNAQMLADESELEFLKVLNRPFRCVSGTGKAKATPALLCLRCASSYRSTESSSTE